MLVENRELLAAILAHPDEDTPRLMYADWLQENNQPEHAEFIRLHIEWDRRPIDALPDDDLRLRLIAAWEAAGLKKAGGIYERGFEAVATFSTLDNFCENAKHEFGSNPIRVMYLGQQGSGEEPPDWEKRFLKVLPSVRGVTGIGAFDSRRGLSQFGTHYLELPQAAELRMIDLGPCAANWYCERIATAKHMTNLLALDLTGAWETDEGCLELLANIPHLRSLLALRLSHDDHPDGSRGYIGPDEIQALTKSRSLTNLRQLVLNNHQPFDDLALSHLLKWKHVENLEVLEFYGTRVTGKGLRALSQSRRLTGLRRLAVSGYEVEPEAIAGLHNSPHLAGLTEMYFDFDDTVFPAALRDRLVARFGDFTLDRITCDPIPVCVEDRIRRRCRLMDEAGSHYWVRTTDTDPQTCRTSHPEYAVL